ncbi:OmpH family outer membrane protein [Rhodohalobacter sp.]|uniref:OmpH family outer membrane protein n=1 Tax=Rhodohalobacter sp. TaxID=1974210 RepID=UPI002ACECA2A|nr:OmpH family outer membrane protein [Rhodohalobacter sp.]MDZ7756676.1 OmpH family outer membrane protein [Rhodohalobacter sp.]
MKKVYTLGFIFLIAITTLMAAPAVQAQDMKIGFVEPRAVLERMPEMKAVQQRLQNFAERKQNELVQKERELQTEVELYQQKVGVISEQARQTEEERLNAMDTEFRQMQQQAQQEMAQQRAELMSPLLEQIQGAIDTVAASKGLDYVLNTTTSAGDVIILYVSPEVREEYDITDEVMVELGI